MYKHQGEVSKTAKSIFEMDIIHSLKTATAGRKSVDESWVSPTALRPLICDDPCLVWLAHHGEKHGFTKDPDQYSLLGWLGDQGAKFEMEWLNRVGGSDVFYANENDHDVRRVTSVLRTAEAVTRQAPIISKAALWWSPNSLYGTADILARVSWLREHLPATQQCLEDEAPDTYVVMDCKMQSRLTEPSKKLDLALASRQVRLYSHIVNKLFNDGTGTRYAFIIPRDHILDPIPVEVNDPLDTETRRMLDLYRRIRDEGAGLRPWRDELVAPNPWNKKNAPWSEAVKTILTERMPSRSVHVIPHVGKRQAEALRRVGLASLDDILTAGPHALRDARVPGFGPKTLAKAEAILAVNCAGNSASDVFIPEKAVPRRVPTELYVDFEFRGAGMRLDYDRWPKLSGREMCFMIGAGYEDEQGTWQFKQFTAHEDSLKAERQMWEEFVSFLRECGVIFGSLQEATPCPEGEAALYHYSAAEVHGSRRAAERVGINVLGKLPWIDLRAKLLLGPTALPGQWDFSLKSVSKALGIHSPEHRVDYPDNLQIGSDAMVMALRAYQRGGEVLNSPEIRLVTEYLEADCRGLRQILRWMRSSPSEKCNSTSKAVKARVTTSTQAFRWYKQARLLVHTTDVT